MGAMCEALCDAAKVAWWAESLYDRQVHQEKKLAGRPQLEHDSSDRVWRIEYPEARTP